ncbi:hypothetical protein SDC9_156370 [bioreactor metagenome]|uniref:DUF3783 domain-containing protein n=1 Tax=bioreactor metagenome TaxID=1076179 RepID=A0A645F6C7_9ZZZZ
MRNAPQPPILSYKGRETMKARIQTGVVLLYGFDDQNPKTETLFKLFRSQRVSVRTIQPQEANQSIGALLSLPNFKLAADAAPVEPPTEKVIVFYAFADAVLDHVLTALRDEALAPDALKAVVTAHNRSWSFAKLANELRGEKQSFAEQGVEEA